MRQVKFIIFLFSLLFLSCKMDSGLSEEKAKEAILGKWQLVSYGMKESDMIDAEGENGNYTEYFSDSTTRSFVMGYFPQIPSSKPPPAGIGGTFTPTYYYTIDAHYLKVMTTSNGIDGDIVCYKFFFYDNNKKLRLTRHPLYYFKNDGEGVVELFMTNFWIYKKL